MKYSFTKFSGAYIKGDTRLSISGSGLIRLTAGFCRLTNALSFQYAVLYFDASNRAIAIKLTNKEEEGVLKITKDKDAATISIKAFMLANHLSLQDYIRRYEWENANITGIGSVYIIKLGK